jgi:hypothetical protein
MGVAKQPAAASDYGCRQTAGCCIRLWVSPNSRLLHPTMGVAKQPGLPDWGHPSIEGCSSIGDIHNCRASLRRIGLWVSPSCLIGVDCGCPESCPNRSRLSGKKKRALETERPNSQPSRSWMSPNRQTNARTMDVPESLFPDRLDQRIVDVPESSPAPS